MYKKDCF